MVQGSSANTYRMSTGQVQSWDNISKKSGFEAIQRREQDKKEEEKKKYGAWGTTFKNKDHFTNMHLS